MSVDAVTRQEMYLQYLAGDTAITLPEPVTRIEKYWWDIAKRIESGVGNGGGITVDSALSETSTNPVQNKVVSKRFGEISEQKVDKTNITLEQHTDGLIYIFVDGKPVGSGVELGTVVDGDVIGTLAEDNNILFSGNLADGTYTLKWLNEDGTYSDAGTLVVGAIEEPEVMVNLVQTLTDVDLTTIYNGIGYKENTRISVSAVSTSNPTGEKTETGTVLTGLLPIGEDGDVLHFRGISGIFDTASSSYTGNVWQYDASGKLLNVGGTAVPTSMIGTDENGDFTVTLKRSNFNNLITGCAYIRFNVGPLTGAFIMTRNQLITV